MSPRVRSEILELLVDPLTADAKYSRQNMANLLELIEMHLS